MVSLRACGVAIMNPRITVDAHGVDIGINGRACVAIAVEIWAELTIGQRATLNRARGEEGSRSIETCTHAVTLRCLRARGLVRLDSRRLTMLGELVLEQGRLSEVARVHARIARRKGRHRAA
jgi:hypothetical protein